MSRKLWSLSLCLLLTQSPWQWENIMRWRNCGNMNQQNQQEDLGKLWFPVDGSRFQSTHSKMRDYSLPPVEAPRPGLSPLATDPLSPCGCRPPPLFTRKAWAVCEHYCCLATQTCGYLLASLHFKHFPLPSGTNYWCGFGWIFNIVQCSFNGEEF